MITFAGDANDDSLCFAKLLTRVIMKIAVIGAGAAGLAAVRHCVSSTYDDQVLCYEKTDQIGGTWVYRKETGSDRYGLPIHTSMYKSLRYIPLQILWYIPLLSLS